jgi:hypothetical protein
VQPGGGVEEQLGTRRTTRLPGVQVRAPQAESLIGVRIKTAYRSRCRT